MEIISQKHLTDLHGQRVLVRVDFNVPLKNGKVEDNTKIKAVLPTIKDLREKGGRIILMSHLGRPKGKAKDDLRMEPVARELRKLMPEAKKDIGYIKRWDFSEIKIIAGEMRDGEILLLENLRFNPGEKKNTAKFAKELASLARVYINDAFASSHRKHASIVGVPKYLPSYTGLLFQREITALRKCLKDYKDPYVVVMGGVKISTKIGAIKNLLKKSDYILIGGALANVFLKAKGLEIGKSVYEKEGVKIAKKLLKNKKIILPLDVVVAAGKKGKAKVKNSGRVGKSEMILDIGPETIKHYSEYIRSAKTIVWNGPLGYYEDKRFSHGSVALGRLMASRSSGRVYGVAGGGETLDVVEMTGMAKYFDHISTAGGAMLEFLEGKKLPGVVALEK